MHIFSLPALEFDEWFFARVAVCDACKSAKEGVARERSSLALIVGTKYDEDVFESDHDQQRPNDQ